MIVRRVWPTRPTFDAPLRDFNQLRREMQRALDLFTAEQGAAPAGVFPPVNVTQDHDHFYVRAELPGVVANDLSISAHRERVVIAGWRELPREHERASYHRRERAEGAFSRTLTLPMPFDPGRVDAQYADGILTLRLPKAEEAKPRQIAVKT